MKFLILCFVCLWLKLIIISKFVAFDDSQYEIIRLWDFKVHAINNAAGKAQSVK